GAISSILMLLVLYKIAGIQNLLDKQYSTVWGQRATLFYSPTYGPAYLYDYQGRGRTYTLTWSMAY
ncbi:MAG: hypothetical protein RR726_42075, partial [Pseudomonas sp.]